MSWNYRVMQHDYIHASGELETWYTIHEVYYRSHEVNDLEVNPKEIGFTQDAVAARADSVEDLKTELKRMLAACDKPVLKYE